MRVKFIGATAHYVTADLDEGPIIEQDVERISHGDTPEDLVRQGRDIERRVTRAAAVRAEDHARLWPRAASHLQGPAGWRRARPTVVIGKALTAAKVDGDPHV